MNLIQLTPKLNITNQTTGFPVDSNHYGMLIGMTGNKAIISNFQNDNLVLATDSTEHLIITPSGNIGIGVSTPHNILHIHKAIGFNHNFNNYKQDETKNFKTTSIYGIQLTNNVTGITSTDGLLIGLTSNGSASIMHQNAMSLSLGVNNTKIINISLQGNVGIGTLSPTAKFHTKGSLRFENLTETTTAQNNKVLLVDADGNVSQAQPNFIGDNFGNHTATQNIKMNDKWISNDGDSKGIKITNNGDILIYGTIPSGQQKTFKQNNGVEIVTRGRIPERRGISVDEDPSGNFNFWIHNWQNPAAFNFMRNDAGTVKKLMVINKNGYVGINTEQSTAYLHVKGNIRFEQLPEQLTINNETVLISNSQGYIKTFPASQLKDNMGNHIATKNIQLNEFWLSPDGNAHKGIRLKENGNVQVGNGITQINFGKSYSNAPYFLSSYIGFNAQRTNQGQWIFASDGANNGGAALISDVAGNLRFVTYRSSQGTTNAMLIESDFIKNTSLILTSNKKIGLFTTYFNQSADVQIKGNTYIEDKMGIGICLDSQNNPKNYRFAVNGTMGAKDIYVEIDETLWPDYVFEPEHQLLSLSELEKYIKQQKHLPDIPLAKDVKEKGISLAEINTQLLKKIEELTLYIIELNKKIEKYEKEK